MNPTQINIKLNPRIKARAEKAAAILGMSLTEYVVRLVDEDTTRVLTSHGRIAQQQARFKERVEACEKSAGSNQGLREALIWAGRLGFDGAINRMGKDEKRYHDK